MDGSMIFDIVSAIANAVVTIIGTIFGVSKIVKR